jgi:hypothetical protein
MRVLERPQETHRNDGNIKAGKPTPTKSTLKALPTVRDHTTDQLGPGGDEYLPREIDETGEKRVMPNGQLLEGRKYRCRTFLVPNRGDKLFMLATECARVLGYRDSYLLFNKNRSDGEGRPCQPGDSPFHIQIQTNSNCHSSKYVPSVR